MKAQPTDEARHLTAEILKLLGPHTTPYSRELTKQELLDQPLDVLRHMLDSAHQQKTSKRLRDIDASLARRQNP